MDVISKNKKKLPGRSTPSERSDVTLGTSTTTVPLLDSTKSRATTSTVVCVFLQRVSTADAGSARRDATCMLPSP